MSSWCDRTGFPLVPLRDLGVALHLFPVTKSQYECFLAEPDSPGDSWYQEILSLNARVPYQRFSRSTMEGLFMTGIKPAEAEAFARWLGDEWMVPTLEVWRSAYKLFTRTRLTQAYLDKLKRMDLSKPAVALVRGALGHVEPETVAELALMTGGVMEWVCDGNRWGALGRPRPEFAECLCDPARGDPVRPLDIDSRLHYFGFRLARSLDHRQPQRGLGRLTF